MALREVEGQRGQRIDHAEVAHVAAVDGLDADDADDDLGRHAVLGFGAGQRVGVGAPEAHAGRDADRVDEAAAVDAPVLRRAPGRRQHQARHVRQQARAADGRAHPCAIEVAPLGHVVGELHRVFARGIGRFAAHGFLGRCGIRGDQQREGERKGGREKASHGLDCAARALRPGARHMWFQRGQASRRNSDLSAASAGPGRSA